MTAWTPNDDIKLQKLFEDGLTSGQVAVKMKRSRNSVIGRYRRLREWGCGHYSKKVLKPRKPRPELTEKERRMKYLWACKNISVQDIKNELGLSDNQYYDMKYKLGLPNRPTVQNIQKTGFRWKLTPWPKDVRFEDSPDALAEPFCFATALRTNAQYGGR